MAVFGPWKEPPTPWPIYGLEFDDHGLLGRMVESLVGHLLKLIKPSIYPIEMNG